MTDLACQRLAAAALGSVLLAATTTQAAAQIRIDRDQTGRTVAIVGLPGSSGCVRGTSIGRVVDRVVEKGELQGFTFNEPPYDDGYINLPAAYDIKDRAAYRRLQAAFDDLFRKGARLKITSVACGAAGRIVKLTSATLLDDTPPRRTAPAAAPAPSPEPRSAEAAGGDGGVKSDDGDDSVLRTPDGPATASAVRPVPAPPTAQAPAALQVEPQAPAPRSPQANRTSRWRLSQTAKDQITLVIRADDAAFSLAIHCRNSGKGLSFTHWFVPPDNWPMNKSATPASIDGRPQRWDVDGAFEGVFFSDNVGGSTAGLSESSLRNIARGERFVIGGRPSRGKQRDAVFHTAGGEGIFDSFTERCHRLPHG